MKKEYTEPKAELIAFDVNDVLMLDLKTSKDEIVNMDDFGGDSPFEISN